MTYRIQETYGKDARERVLQNFDEEFLEREQKRAEEDLSEIQQFLIALKGQRITVGQTTFRPEVEIHKDRNYSTGHINYRVNSYLVPEGPGREKLRIHKFYDEGKLFPSGHDKKAAIEYARELSTKHGNCPIISNFITGPIP